MDNRAGHNTAARPFNHQGRAPRFQLGLKRRRCHYPLGVFSNRLQQSRSARSADFYVVVLCRRRRAGNAGSESWPAGGHRRDGDSLPGCCGDVHFQIQYDSRCFIFRFSTTQDAPSVAVKQVFGLIYIPFFMSFIVLLYDGGSIAGIHWIFLLLLIVVAGDTGAYFTGRFLGRRKLCPSVSPKKTIEGAVGGLLCSVVFAIAYKLIFMPELSLFGTFLLASVTGMVGQAGDLFESEFKRVSGVKDSGGLLPGHGGMLDRIDALLLAAPTAYLLKEYLLT